MNYPDYTSWLMPWVVVTNKRTEHFATSEAAALFIRLHITHYLGSRPERLVYTNARGN